MIQTGRAEKRYEPDSPKSKLEVANASILLVAVRLCGGAGG